MGDFMGIPIRLHQVDELAGRVHQPDVPATM